MLPMTTQLCRQKVAHWYRSAAVPMAMTSGSSRKMATSWGAKINPAALTASSSTKVTFTLNQKPSRTRRYSPAP